MPLKKIVSQGLQGSLRGVSRVYQGCSYDVPRLQICIFLFPHMLYKITLKAVWQSTISKRPLWKVAFHPLLSSIKDCFPSEVIFLFKLFSTKGHLSSKVVFHQSLSSIKVCLPSKGVSSINGSLPSEVIFHQKSSSIKGPFPSIYLFLWVVLKK